MKIFISQPMKDKTDEEIKLARALAIRRLKIMFPDDKIEVLDSFFEGAPHDAKPLWFLGKSFELLSTADAAYFIGDWGCYRGCSMEHEACCVYGIDIIED